ncbi:molybdopterin-dependent oxidoreductase [Novosphingobium sp. 9U]|uniref:molybdopterin-containing oxidoreductase family protein n=1 Tax=Novosphingobium sp. 9U TaxID=2653158 RepID=UPI0012F33A8D|nr:molybdopterin-dependent oxidoreductase [Novosphingobium sp. 9U]VWX54198.1 putative Nitrate reductase [Novosphingobium sp. 9U]
MTMQTVKTFCRNCSALCAMEIDVEDGVPLRARPDASHSPYGGYLCPKGISSIEFQQGAENRLFASLKRQAHGQLSPISNDTATQEIGDKLAALLAEHGPRSIAVYHGTGAYRSVLGGLMERAWVSAIGTPSFFSSMTIDQSAKWVTMGRMGIMASGRHAFRDADLVLLAGGNPVVTHQGAPFALSESGAPGRAFEHIKQNGGRIIIVDPRRTETARYADLLIQPLPGHDAAVFAAIAHILLRDGTYDRDFATRHCSQLEELRAAVVPFTPELASTRADVPVEAIETAARWLGEARRPTVGSGTGPSMAAHSNLADHMIEAVNVLSGGYRRAGDRVRNPGTLKPKVAREMALAPTRSWEHAPKCVSQDVGPIMGEFPTALLPAEILADSPDRIRALIVFGGDPLVAVGDPARAKPGFEALELLVSVDSRLNETGKLADYVIASSHPLERHDLSVSADSLAPEPFVQYTEPVVAKPAGLIDDWEFFWRISSRMGVPLEFKFWSYGLRYEDVPLALSLSTVEPPDPEDLCRFLCSESRVPFDTLKASPGGVRPEVEPHFVQPAPVGWQQKLELCPADVAHELAELAREVPQPVSMQLICRRVLHALNGAFRDSARTRSRLPVNYAYMASVDMAAFGLQDGDLVELRSAHGTLKALAREDARLRRGVVSMTHMFGPLVGGEDPVTDGGSNVGQLTSLGERLQPINFMPLFSGIPIDVRKIAPTPTTHPYHQEPLRV